MEQVVFSASDEDFADILAGFCREQPIQNDTVMADGEPVLDENGDIVTTDYTQKEWLKKCVAEKYVMKRAIKGWNKLKLDNDPIDQDRIKDIINNL